MNWKGFLWGLLLAGTLLAVLITSPSYGENPKNADIKIKDLQGLVDLLENPDRREAFLKDLKNLIQLKEAATRKAEEMGKPPKKKEVLAIEKLFMRFESLSKSILDAAAGTTSLVARAPIVLRNAKSFLAETENRSKLLRLLGDVAGGIFIALIAGLLLRRYIPKIEQRKITLLYKLATGLIRVVLAMAPYGVLLVSLFILFDTFPSFQRAHALALIFFLVLFFYRLARAVFRVLLSPENGKIRILPLSDRDANYLWIWAVRITNYTAFYFLVIKVLFVVELAYPSFLFIRGILLILFPLMISMFILQVARQLRIKYENSQERDDGSESNSKKSAALGIRYWPILAIAYSWAIFIFLIVHYDEGFRYLFSATLGTAIVILALFLALRLLDWVFIRLFAINEKVKRKFPGLEEKTNRYIQIIKRGVGGIVVIFGLGFIAQVWGIPISTLVTSRTGSWFIFKAIAIVITMGVVIAIIETSKFVCDRLLEEKEGEELSKKRKTLIPLISTVIKIGSAFIGGIVILDQIGVNTAPILAGAGIVGLAVGFGAQSLVKDVINGLFILFQDLISVGDVAVIGDKGGLVEAVGLRTVKLRDLAGNVHVIPNSSIDTVTNMTKGYSRYVFDIGVAYKEDIDEVMEVLREIGVEMQNDAKYGKDILEPLEILGVDRFADSAVIIKARITTKPIRQWTIGREFNRRMKKAFDQRGIEIPFPHRTIYMGEPKEGPAPSLQLHLQEIKASQWGKNKL